jgi:hypothetical protein
MVDQHGPHPAARRRQCRGCRECLVVEELVQREVVGVDFGGVLAVHGGEGRGARRSLQTDPRAAARVGLHSGSHDRHQAGVRRSRGGDPTPLRHRRGSGGPSTRHRSRRIRAGRDGTAHAGSGCRIFARLVRFRLSPRICLTPSRGARLPVRRQTKGWQIHVLAIQRWALPARSMLRRC